MKGTTETSIEKQGSEAADSLPYHLSALFVILLIAATAYFETLRSMADLYLRSDTFMHGFIILPISFYLVWRKWPQLEPIAPRIFVPGIFLFLAISTIWFFADILGIQVGKHFAVAAIIPAAVVTVMGVSFARSIAFPLAYLLFAVPFGEFWVPELQEITADFAVGLLRLTGVPVLRDGLFLSIPTGNFEVAEACSGIRYILASFALGTLYAYLSYRRNYKRLIFIVFSLVLPIVANGIRAYGIIAIAYYSDMKYAVGVDHLIYGWVFFGVVIGLMFLVGNRYSDDGSSDHRSASVNGRDAGRPQLRQSIAFAALAAAIAVTAGPLASHVPETKHAEQIALLNGLPEVVASWQGTVLSEPDWRPSFIGATQDSLVRYRGPDAQVDVALIQFSRQQQGRELANRLNSILGDNGWRQRNIRKTSVCLADGTSIQLFETSAERHGLVRQFWYWYDVDGDAVLSSLRIKLLEAKSLITGRPGISSAIIISMIDDGNSRDTLRTFLVDAFDAIDTCLTAVSPQEDCDLGLPRVRSEVSAESAAK